MPGSLLFAVHIADGVLGCEDGGITLIAGWNWYTGADPSAVGVDQYDFETIVLHELGHAVGLGHDTAWYPVNDGYDVMNPTAATGVARCTYSANDVRELRYLY